MINKKIVDNYLNRKLENWDWLKEAKEHDLIEEIKHHFLEFNPKITPFKHQIVSIFLGIVNPQFNFFLDMGLGKTFVILNLIQYWKGKTLVLVPNEVNVLSWKNEIEKFTDLKAIGVSGSSSKKINLLNGNGDIFISNYMGFLRIFTLKKGKKTIINEKIIDSLLSKFDIVVFDEIHKLGNSKSLITLLCDLIPSKIRYGLTGTPFGKSPERLWSEFKVIDNGETLGNKETLFKNTFFTKAWNNFGGLDYHFKNNLSDKLHEIIKNKSITYDSEECVDLPVLSEQKCIVKLDKEGQKYYNQSHDSLAKELKDGETAIENSFVRLRAISAGYLYFKDEDNNKTKSDLVKNPKLDYLIELIKDIDEKCLVFNEYTLTGDVIEDRLKKENIRYVRLYGKTKNKQEVIKVFQHSKNVKVFLLNSQSGGTGTNLQFCRYAFFYENSVDPITHKQCIKRIYRIGQDKKTFIYYLLMGHTVDEKILLSLEKGENLYKSIIKGREI